MFLFQKLIKLFFIDYQDKKLKTSLEIHVQSIKQNKHQVK